MHRGPILLVCLLTAGIALAEGPTTSIRPVSRPAPAQPATATATAPALPSVATTTTAAVPQPKARPAGLVTAAPPEPARPEPAMVPAQDPALAGQSLPKVSSLRPKPRPANLFSLAAAAPAPPAKSTRKKPRKGSICGDADLRGEALSAIPAKTKGCGLAEPVKVTMIGEVALNPAPTLSCETASALKQWIEQGMQPAFGNRQVIELKVAASYICRSRNNVKGARISEHGRGKAIDISGFVMSDGTTWTVARDYNKTVRAAHKAACGIFGTTLGPGSDGYHEDHLHFDIARYSGGPYCR